MISTQQHTREIHEPTSLADVCDEAVIFHEQIRRMEGLLEEIVSTAHQERTIVVMPAYNAAATLERTVRDLPLGVADEIILVDDCSRDDTVEVARQLGLTVIRRRTNGGYGANQKTCYRFALERGADYVVMLHPDYQYDSRLVGIAVSLMKFGICDVVLGSRIRTRGEALTGGMPRYKYVANRALTTLENVAFGQNLGDFHSGFRAYRRKVLETVPYQSNSDDFVFDSEFLAQAAHFGFRIGDIPVPVRYFPEASSINFRRSLRYGLETLRVIGQFWAHRLGLRSSSLFQSPSNASEPLVPSARHRVDGHATASGSPERSLTSETCSVSNLNPQPPRQLT